MVEAATKGGGQKLWRLFRKSPSLAVLAIGGTALMAAVEVGAAELAFSLAVSYAAYLVLREGVPLQTALKDVSGLIE